MGQRAGCWADNENDLKNVGNARLARWLQRTGLDAAALANTGESKVGDLDDAGKYKCRRPTHPSSVLYFRKFLLHCLRNGGKQVSFGTLVPSAMNRAESKTPGAATGRIGLLQP